MSAVLKDAALVVGVVAIGVATAGVGAFGAAAATAVGAAGAAGAVGLSSAAALAAALGGLSAGLSFVSQLTAKKPSQTVNPMTWQSDPEAGIPYVMGRIYVGGQIVYRQAWGSHNDHETIITAYSAGPVSAFEQLYVDGVATSYVNGGQVAILDRGKMYASVQLGAQPEAKQLGDLGPPGWTSASKLSGLAASSITFVYDAKGDVTFTTEPQVGFVVQGVTAYDPRQDSTYPGGSGPQRATDETTWTYSENPALHALSYLLGRRQNGKLVIGVGAALANIIVPQYVEAANVGDANGWTISANISSTDNKWQRLKDILAAGGAEPLRLGAQIGCLVRMPRVSLATIDASEVVGAAKCQATQSRRDRLNAIVPRYMAEQSETLSVNGSLRTTVTWGMASASPVVVQDYVTFDGGQRQKQVDYGFVTKLLQAQQLARYDIEDSREFGPITLPLKLRWYGYRPGDVVTINHPQLGLNGQDVLILSRSLNPQACTVTITARSETYAKHAFALGQTGVAPPTPGVTGPPLLPTPGATAWAIVAEVISANGTTIPGLVLAGSSDSPVADGIVFEYRPSVTGEEDGANWIAAGIEPAGTTGKAITGVEDGTAYQCAVSYRVGPNVGARLILGPVTAGQTSVQWSTGIVGQGKPQDGATVGAPAGTMVANVLAEDVVTRLSTLTQGASDVDEALARIEAEARQGAPNLLLNGDFSAGLDHWSASAPGVFAAATYPTVGTYATSSAGNGAGRYIFQNVPVVPGTGYSFSAELAIYNGASAGIGAKWVGSDLNDLPNAVVEVISPPANWTDGRHASAVYTAPAQAAYLQVYVAVLDTATVIDLTRLMVQAGPATAWRNDASQAAVTQQVTQLAGDGAAYARSLQTVTAQLAGTADSGLKTNIAAVSNLAQAGVDASNAVAKRASDLEATVNGGNGQQGLTAIVQDQAGVIASATGKLTAWFSQVANVGGTGMVGIVGNATRSSDGTTTSNLALIAGTLGVWMPRSDGSLLQAMGIEQDGSGNTLVRFYGQVQARSIDTNSITIGGVSWDNLSAGLGSDGSATWSGSITPGAGQTAQIPLGLVVPNVKPRGRFFVDASMSVTSNAGQVITNNYNGTGKNLVTTYLQDFSCGIVATDPQGNRYDALGAKFQPVLASTAFDAQFQAFVTRGNTDTGVVNQGDFYTRDISATPTAVGASGHIAWVAT